MLLFAALLRSIHFPTAQLISALACAALAIVVTLLPIVQNGWGPLMFCSWFFVSLLSYLIVRLVLHKEFETASLRASLLLAVPLFVSAVMLSFAGSAMLAELAVAGGIAVAATYLAQRSSALGHGFVEITLLFHFLLLLNCTIYVHLPPVLALLQWIVPALVILLAQPLHHCVIRSFVDVGSPTTLSSPACGGTCALSLVTETWPRWPGTMTCLGFSTWNPDSA